MKTNPKVFISHASEDKIFVLDFAKKLREKGVDAWVDKWEMLPGDSLVDKIFEEGIKNAQAVIVVLSKHSVAKKWVREELNAAFIQRIEGKTRLIPVVIDDCEVPTALQSILWEKLSDINRYDQEFSRILSAIFGQTDKPSIGELPKYTQTQLPLISGLSKVDTLVLKIICEKSVKQGQSYLITSNFQAEVTEYGISEDEFLESLEILSNLYYIKGEHELGSEGLKFFEITSHGFHAYADVFMSNFDRFLGDIIVTILNTDLDTNKKIAEEMSQPLILIDYAIDILHDNGCIKISKTFGGSVSIDEVTVNGKRFAREITNLR